MNGRNVSRRAMGLAGAGAGIAALGAAAGPAAAKKRCTPLDAVYVPADLITFATLPAAGGRLAQGVRATIATTGSAFAFAPDQQVTETAVTGMLPVAGARETVIYRIVGTPLPAAGDRLAASEWVACTLQVLSAAMDEGTGVVTADCVVLDMAGDVAGRGTAMPRDLRPATLTVQRRKA